VRIKRIPVLSAVGLFFVLMQTGLAQEQEKKEDIKGFDLGQVVVTATRTQRQIANIPASVSVIGSEDIKASAFERVDDILRATAGLNVDYHYGMHTVAGNRPVNLRGTGGYGERTLVLVDGVPQNNANNGWVEWSQIPKEAIERIEIVRGPSSALYGSNAMGGVINIITKKPEKGRETWLQQSVGTMGTWSTKLTQQEKIGKWGYFITGGYGESDGYNASKPRFSYDIKRFSREDRILAKLFYDIDEDSGVSFGFSRYHHKLGRGRKYFYGYTENYRYWLDWFRNDEKVQWKGQLFVNDDKWDSYFDKAPNYNSLYRREVIPMLAIGGSLQSSIELSNWNSLTIGVDYKHSDLEKKDRYYSGPPRSSGVEGKQRYISTFINDEIKLFDDALIVSLGGRFDYIKAYDGKNWDTNPGNDYDNNFSSEDWSRFSPKLGVAWHLSESTTLKSSIGKGFKAPSLYELYTTLTRGPLYIECNPELKPEKVLSYDLTLEHLFSEFLMGRASIYQSHAKDFIGYDTITSTHWKRDNISKVRMRGIEMELEGIMSQQWQWFANYTYNESKIREYSADSSVEGNFLPYTPRHKVGLGLTYTNPQLFDSRLVFNYRNKRYTDNENTSKLDSSCTVDFSISRQVSKNCELALNIENLFDDDYTIYKSTTQDTVGPGRVITGTMTIKF